MSQNNRASVSNEADGVDAFAPTRANYERFAFLLLRLGRVPGLGLSHLDFRVALFLLAPKPGAYAALLDLPGQPRGVVVARSGFQEGAERFAKAHDIVLYELRAPRDEDWEGFITGINIKGELLVPKLHEVQFKTDEEWLAEQLRRCGLPSAASLSSITGRTGELLIEREDGSVLTTVGDVIEGHLVPPRGPAQWVEYVFPEVVYIATGFPRLPRVRLRGLRVLIELVVAITQALLACAASAPINRL